VNQFLQDKMRGVEDTARDAAQKLVWRLLLGITVGLIWLAGIGFLTTSVFLALSAVMGIAWAALLIGLLLVLVGAGPVAIINYQWSKKELAKVPETPPAAGADASNVATTVAFTAAFVLARYLGGEKPD
jgi:small-conductance mechanosensitive channel